MEWWIYVLLALVVLVLLPALLVSGVIYTVLLVRTSRDKFGRKCSFPDDEEYVRMFNIGLAWGEKWKDRKRDVNIVSDGLHLVGEYYDFGGKTAVIIIAGRTECLLYSYYFAEPFRRAGCNVLVIDNRAHGLSEGRVSCLGYKEYRDILRWCELLHDELGNEKVLLHGICIGASTALFAATDAHCPDYVAGMSAEGMYVNFYESFLNHLRLDRPKAPHFPVLQMTMLMIRLFSGADVVNDGPIKRIGKLKKPILFLHSREDQFSTPDQAELLYENCTAPKQLVWFDRGAHSRIRINNTEKYDETIVGFVQQLDDPLFFPINACI
jgi:alpha-beta hydrolase superfamily lysophospholipase